MSLCGCSALAFVWVPAFVSQVGKKLIHRSIFTSYFCGKSNQAHNTNYNNKHIIQIKITYTCRQVHMSISNKIVVAMPLVYLCVCVCVRMCPLNITAASNSVSCCFRTFVFLYYSNLFVTCKLNVVLCISVVFFYHCRCQLLVLELDSCCDLPSSEANKQ